MVLLVLAFYTGFMRRRYAIASIKRRCTIKMVSHTFLALKLMISNFMLISRVPLPPDRFFGDECLERIEPGRIRSPLLQIPSARRG